GSPRDDHAVQRAHEPGPWMSVPMWLLVVPTVLFGGAGLLASGVTTWTDGSRARLAPAWPATLLPLALLVLGFVVVLLVFRRSPATDPAVVVARGAYPALAAGFGMDEFYDRTVVRPGRRLANITVAADAELTDAGDTSGVAASRLGRPLRAGQDGNPQRDLTVVVGGVAVAALVLLATLTGFGVGR